MSRPFTTLFILMSVDAKISTGATNNRDFDKDLNLIKGAREGLKQYYDIEQTTDLYSFNSGKVFEKIGINNTDNDIEKMPVSFIVVDNKPHLSKKGVFNLLKKSKHLFIVTHNLDHPSFAIEADNLEILYYDKRIDFINLFERLKKDYYIDRITIQSGGTLNSVLLRNGLIDEISIVVAPILIGGKDTPSLVDGFSLSSKEDLKFVSNLKLKEIRQLKNSYLYLRYSIINNME